MADSPLNPSTQAIVSFAVLQYQPAFYGQCPLFRVLDDLEIFRMECDSPFRLEFLRYNQRT